jgi:molybdate transport system regulatory protein
LVSRQKGGAGGGTSSLTPRAAALLEKFELLQSGFNDMVNSKFIELDF